MLLFQKLDIKDRRIRRPRAYCCRKCNSGKMQQTVSLYAWALSIGHYLYYWLGNVYCNTTQKYMLTAPITLEEISMAVD